MYDLSIWDGCIRRDLFEHVTFYSKLWIKIPNSKARNLIKIPYVFLRHWVKSV